MFTAVGYVTRRNTFPVDPIYVSNYSTLRGISTGSLLAFVTGRFGTGVAEVGIQPGWFQADPNDLVTADDNANVLVATNGYRWKRIFTIDSVDVFTTVDVGTPVVFDLTVTGPTVAMNPAVTRIVMIFIDGIQWNLDQFTIALPNVTVNALIQDLHYMTVYAI